jgi:hypothetical protein
MPSKRPVQSSPAVTLSRSLYRPLHVDAHKPRESVQKTQDQEREKARELQLQQEFHAMDVPQLQLHIHQLKQALEAAKLQLKCLQETACKNSKVGRTLDMSANT